MIGIKKFLIVGFFIFTGFKPLEQQPKSLLSEYKLDGKPAKITQLSFELREISGLCLTSSGKLFCHHDELGEVFQLDSQTGKILKSFFVSYRGLFGREAVKADFEGIAYARNQFYLISSDGLLYEFSEGENQEYVPYKKYDTDLSRAFDIEGLCFDEKTNALLIACKESPGEYHKKDRVVFSFSLKTYRLNSQPRFRIPIKSVMALANADRFNPSGIEINPFSGTFFILASHGQLVLEISSQGELLNAQPLDKKLHAQPEGIAFLPDGSLLIANEGKKNGLLVTYPLQKK
ncbi:SdiA-regulated domain-containing protein [Chloroherpeton thalassium]|nr:SdiA-regulated domain-containing protein [Chloroherpeton thalassium]